MIDNFVLYPSFKENKLYGRYITNDSIYKLNKLYRFKVLGRSVDEKPIYYFNFGSGKKKILIWSQMHGNESTSTRALFDALSYFSKFDNNTLLNITLHIIPILNPDGATNYSRENSNKIDLNRDAFDLTQKESRILKDLYIKINPDFCFNLHDQRSIYSVSNTNKPSVLSFLSPSANINKSETNSRIIAMKIISSLANRLSKLIPGCFSRYNDDFNINCVGDTFQSMKTPTILFESGHYKNDYTRENTRKYMSYALIHSLKSIAYDEFKEFNHKNYYSIPENDTSFRDILLRNVKIRQKEKSFRTDITIMYKEVFETSSNKINLVPYIDKIGNLISMFGHLDLDFKNNERIFNIDNINNLMEEVNKLRIIQ